MIFDGDDGDDRNDRNDMHNLEYSSEINMKIDDEPIPNVSEVSAFDPILFLDV